MSTDTTPQSKTARDEDDTTMLRVEGLTKKFGDLVAVNDISFSAEQGELTSLLGPSGCGKTTTLRCIAGLERPTSGQIYIDGELVSDGDDILVPAEDRDLGMVFQSYAIWPHMNVERNVGYALELRDFNKEERKQRVEEVLDIVGLSGLQDNHPSELSGGQQQRVVLARSLAYNPEVLLLDEPLANLDAKLRRKMQRELNDIQETTGITSIYVTHDQEEGMILSDKMLVLKDGEIVERGPPEILFNQPKNRHTADFLGKSNMIPARIEEEGTETVRVTTDLGSIENIDTTNVPDTKDPVLFIRPNNIRIRKDSGSQSFDSEGLIVEGEIETFDFIGEFTEYIVDIDGSDEQLWVSSTSNSLDYHVGDSVECFLPMEYCKLL